MGKFFFNIGKIGEMKKQSIDQSVNPGVEVDFKIRKANALKYNNATALCAQGNLAYSENKISDALNYHLKENKIFLEIISSEPQNETFLHGLTISFLKLSKTYFKLNDLDNVKYCLEKASQNVNLLNTLHPEDYRFKNLNATYLNNAAFYYETIGEDEKAIEYYLNEKEILKSILLSSFSTPQTSISYFESCRNLFNLSKILDIIEDPILDNIDWNGFDESTQRNAYIVNIKSGDIYRLEQKNYDKAIKKYQIALDILKSLYQANLSDRSIIYDLSVLYYKIIQALTDKSNFERVAIIEYAFEAKKIILSSQEYNEQGEILEVLNSISLLVPEISDTDNCPSESTSNISFSNANKKYEEGIEALYSGNLSEAYELFIQAANLGNTKAQNRLGMMYLKGIVVNKNIDSSIFWFEKSAIQGDSDAIFNLYNIYSGKIDENFKDTDKYFYWINLACKNDDSQAQFDFAMFIFGLENIDSEITQNAINMLGRAAYNGHEQAKEMYSKLQKQIK